MKAKLWLPVAAVVGFAFTVSVPTQSSADDFYKGKTIRFVVGLAPGGGLISRLGRWRGTWGSIFPEILPSSLKI